MIYVAIVSKKYRTFLRLNKPQYILDGALMKHNTRDITYVSLCEDILEYVPDFKVNGLTLSGYIILDDDVNPKFLEQVKARTVI